MAIFSLKNLRSHFKFERNNNNNNETESNNNNNKATIINKSNANKTCQRLTLQRCAKIFRILVAVGCLGCYILSVYIITYMYLQFDTVVSTDYIKFSYLPLPAVTACVPFAISYSQLCRKLNFTDQTECYENMKRAHHISSLDDFVTSLTAEGEMDLVQSYHTDRYLTSGPVMGLIDFSFFRTAKLNCVAATGKVKTSYAGLDFFAESNCHTNHNTSRVFSLIYNNKKIGRSAQLCQTFFSQFDTDYDESKFTINLKLNSNKMAFFKFELLSSWFPPEHNPEGISISLHPPNLIPSDLDFKYFNLKANKSYEIEFEREISNLLPPPYKTMCDDYDSTEIDGISRIDCIRRCVFRRSWDDKLQCRNQWNVILLHDLAHQNETLCPIDDSKDDQYHQIREDCEQKCRKNCVEMDYEVTIEVVDDNINGLFNHIAANSESNDSSVESNAFSNINDVCIKHHTGPELIITHSADTIFSTFMSNVGGLGGIYLGLSIFALYNYLVALLRKIRKFFNFQSETKRHKKESISFQSEVVNNRNIRQLRPFKKYHTLDLIPVEKYNLQLPPIKEIDK